MTSAMTHPEERELLHAAFRSFDEAAHTLQQSYSALTTRVEQMDLELAQSNEALRRQLCDNEAMRVHLDGILESLSMGVLVMDDCEMITRSNRAAEALLGVTDDELRNRRASEILAGAGLGVCDRPQRICQAVVSISRVPLHNDSGEHSGHLILFQDITRIYQLEEQLQRKERLAAMGELIGGSPTRLEIHWAASSSSRPCCSAISASSYPPNATPNKFHRPSSRWIACCPISCSIRGRFAWLVAGIRLNR